MDDLTRRRMLLRAAQTTAAALLAACAPTKTSTDTEDADTVSDTDVDTDTTDTGDPLAGKLVGVVPFVGEQEREIGVLTGEGLDGRRVYDVSSIDEDTLITPTEDFFVRTAPSDLPDGDWEIRVRGRVAQPTTLRLEDLPAPADMGAVMVECSGNTSYGGFGLLSAAQWRGIPVSAVLSKIKKTASATRVKISGVDDHPPSTGSSVAGAAWVFTPEQLAGAFFATALNGEPLPTLHGGPLRLVVPGWYGCACIKWVDEIEMVDDDEPATSQMQEFASRTHQSGAPALARDYRAATMGLSAVPVRVEQWRFGEEVRYRIVGIVWGGSASDGPLQIGFDDEDYADVQIAVERNGDAMWGLWTHWWRPSRTGLTTLTMRLADSGAETIRLDGGWYWRTVDIVDS